MKLVWGEMSIQYILYNLRWNIKIFVTLLHVKVSFVFTFNSEADIVFSKYTLSTAHVVYTEKSKVRMNTTRYILYYTCLPYAISNKHEGANQIKFFSGSSFLIPMHNSPLKTVKYDCQFFFFAFNYLIRRHKCFSNL